MNAAYLSPKTRYKVPPILHEKFTSCVHAHAWHACTHTHTHTLSLSLSLHFCSQLSILFTTILLLTLLLLQHS